MTTRVEKHAQSSHEDCLQHPAHEIEVLTT